MKSPRSTWLVIAAVGAGAAATVTVLCALLVLFIWLRQGDSEAGENHHPADTPATSTAKAEAFTPSAEATQSESAASKVTPLELREPAEEDQAESDSADSVRSNPEKTEPDIGDNPQPAGVATTQPRPSTDIEIDFADIPVIGAPKAASPSTKAAEEAGAEESERAERFDAPFFVMGWAPSTDGQQAVLWGYDKNPERSSFSREPFQPPSRTYLQLVDLAARKTLAERAIDALITSVACNSAGVYVSAKPDQGKQQMEVLRLSLPELKTIDRESLLAGTMVSIADRFLFSKNGSRGSQRYSLPNLEPSGSFQRSASHTVNLQDARRVADGWTLDGVLWDDALNDPLLLMSPQGFQRFVGTLPLQQSSINTEPVLQGYLMYVPVGPAPNPGDWRAERPRFSPHVPAVLYFRTRGGERYLDFVSQTSGEPFRSVSLARGAHRLVDLVTTPKWILLSVNGDAMIVPAENADAPIERSFRIEPRQSTMAFSATKPATVRYVAEGAAKFELDVPALRTNMGRFSLQSRTGEFTIDMSGAVAGAVKQMSESAARNHRAFQGDVAVWAESYIDETRPEFVRLAGREPDGVPLALEVYVRAYGDDLSVAVLRHVYLVELPLAEFEKHRGEPSAPRVAARPPRVPPRPGASAQQVPRPPAAAAPADDNFRTWTDTTGRTLQARFLRVDGQTVVVIDKQRRTLRLPLDRLSEQDRVWAAQQAEEQQPDSGDK